MGMRMDMEIRGPGGIAGFFFFVGSKMEGTRRFMESMTDSLVPAGQYVRICVGSQE